MLTFLRNCALANSKYVFSYFEIETMLSVVYDWSTTRQGLSQASVRIE